MQVMIKTNQTISKAFLVTNRRDRQTTRFRPSVAKRRGVILLMYMSILMLMLGFCSLAVDFGHIVLVQTEVRNAADAAAHAAAQQLLDSGSTQIQTAVATTAAQQVALLNQVEGKPVVIANSDVQIGNWDATKTPNFSTTRSPLNAAQVTVHLDASHGNQVSLLFAASIGCASTSLSETAIAYNTTMTSPYGFAGLDSVTFGSIGVLARIHGDVVSNGTISIGEPLGLGVTVTGDARSSGGQVGYGSFASVAGSTASLSQSLIYPIPSAPSSNDNAQISGFLDGQQDFNAVLAADIPAGTYVVRDLDLIAGLLVNLHGPTTFYVTGNFNMAASINLLGSCNTDPSSLNVIMVGGGSVNFLANLLTPIAMNLYAPQTPITIAVGVNQYTGSIIGKSLNICLPVVGTFNEVKPTQAGAITTLVQ
jgi:Flp pilus assembly protein TadG